MRGERGRRDARRGARIAQQPAAAILAAGGRGARLGSPLPKQFGLLGDRSVLAWSLDPLVGARCAPVVIVAPPDLLEEARAISAGVEDATVVPGGESRQASVANGLQHVHTVNVVIHDAARPFATAAEVHAVLGALDHADGAIVAFPVDDTLKRVDRDHVRATVDRSLLWRAQTPQAFRTEVLREAHRQAARDGFEATDDAELLERYGRDVRIVRGRATNIKLTHREDLDLAEALLRSAP